MVPRGPLELSFQELPDGHAQTWGFERGRRTVSEVGSPLPPCCPLVPQVLGAKPSGLGSGVQGGDCPAHTPTLP